LKEAGILSIPTEQIQALMSRVQSGMVIHVRHFPCLRELLGIEFDCYVYKAAALSSYLLDQYMSLHVALKLFFHQHWSYVLCTFVGIGIHLGFGKRVLSLISSIYSRFKKCMRCSPIAVGMQRTDREIEVFPPIPRSLDCSSHSKASEYQIPKILKGVSLDNLFIEQRRNIYYAYYIASWGGRIVERAHDVAVQKQKEIRLNVFPSHVAFFQE
jgi:hypothetical protein